MINAFKKSNFMILFLLVVVTSIFMTSIFMPIKVYADENATDIFSDFDVKFGETEGENGSPSLNITGQANANAAWKTLIDKYKGFITGIAAVGAVTMVVLFIMQFLKLGASAGNPSARSQALTGVLWTGIAAAGLGAVALITGIFYKAI